MSVLGDIGNFLTSAAKDTAKMAEGGAIEAATGIAAAPYLVAKTVDPNIGSQIAGMAKGLYHDVTGTGKAAPEKKKAKKKEPAKPKPLTDKQIETAIQNDPFNQIEQSITGQEEAATENLSPLLGGANANAAAGQGNATALAALGLGPQSSAAQWLSGATQQAGTMNAPLIDAMNNYQALYQQSLGPVTNALSNLGSAEALQIATAPEESWLSALASKIPTEAIYNQQLPPNVQLPSWLAELYGNLGVQPATKGTYGVTGATNALTPAGTTTPAPTSSGLQPTSSSSAG